MWCGGFQKASAPPYIASLGSLTTKTLSGKRKHLRVAAEVMVKDVGQGRAGLTQWRCITPHPWESFAETLTFKENIWGSLLQEINFTVFLTCIYKKLERILSRQYWSGERTLQLCWLHKCFACAVLKEQRRTKGGKKKNTQKPLVPSSSKPWEFLAFFFW